MTRNCKELRHGSGRTWAAGIYVGDGEFGGDCSTVHANRQLLARLDRLERENQLLKRERRDLDEQVRLRTLCLEQEIAMRRDVEREVKELNGKLEQRVLERTRELETTIKDLQTFSFTISHDLRAPLRSINSFASELLEEHGPSLDYDGQQLVSTIIKRTVSMSHLIDDLLRFSRNSMQQLAVQEIDMNQLVREVLRREFGSAPERGRVAIEVGRLPPALGDPAMIGQVLENLLSNAVKFSREAAKPRVDVGGEPGQTENVYFVRDNGIGFDMKYANTIFGVFQRLHGADQYEGTGVGLAIVEQVVTKHGGRVWAESGRGTGATFYFSLPCPEKAEAAG